MRLGKYPPGWDEKKVRRVLKHHEQQTEEEAVNSQKGSSPLFFAFSGGQRYGRFWPERVRIESK
jgi:hypothetical protein